MKDIITDLTSHPTFAEILCGETAPLGGKNGENIKKIRFILGMKIRSIV